MRKDRRPFTYCLSVLILTIASSTAGLWAQSKPSTPAVSGKSGSILVDTDDSCRLVVDGQDQGVVKPDEAKKVMVGLGDHVIKCTVEGISDLAWRKAISVKDSNQVVVLVSLKALHIQYAEATAKLEKAQPPEPSSAPQPAPSSAPAPEHSLEPALPNARGSIGVMFSVEDPGELVLTGVVVGAPADQAGLKEGDVILAMDGQAVSRGKDFLRIMGQKSPGSKVTVKFHRAGAASSTSNSVLSNGNGPQRGVRVGRVGGFWEEMNLDRGATILEINKKPVRSEDDFRAIVGGMHSGQDIVLLVQRPGTDGNTFAAGTFGTDPATTLDQIEFVSSNAQRNSVADRSGAGPSEESTVVVTVADRAKLFAIP